MKKFFKKIFKKFGSHYAIERFGVLFLSLVLCMGFILGTITTRKIHLDKRTLSGQAVYTRTFRMSQSRTTGTVAGLYVNSDHTKCLLWVRFASMAVLPIDAKNYSLYLSGVNIDRHYETILSSPSAKIYLFGTSGDMMIYLTDPNGFPSQLLRLYLRSNASIGTQYVTGYEDESFNKNDQAEIFFNPGGAYAKRVGFLDYEDWTMFQLVEEVFTRNNELGIRSSLKSSLYNIALNQAKAQEYISRLESFGVQIPDTPEAINDVIYGMANDNSTTEQLHYITEFGGGWVTPDGSKGYRNSVVTLYMDTDFVIPGGYDFEWQKSRVLNGYLANLTGSDSWTDWLSYVNRKNNVTTFNFENILRNIQWQFTDGTPVQFGGLTQRERDIESTINLLLDVWRTIYSYKEKYQVETLPQLLQLEINARSAFEYYTVNDGSENKVITLW